jgi:hypothetical protein
MSAQTAVTERGRQFFISGIEPEEWKSFPFLF